MDSTPAIEAWRWLLSADGAAHLSAIAQSDLPLHRQVESLRREATSEQTALLIEQAELRARAAAKFRLADQMFFTRTSLEQATDQWVAEYKARRFEQYDNVADLCCGIGGDLIALARVAHATGIDRDSVTALLAGSNLRANSCEHASVQIADASSEWVAAADAWHADPDRRAAGKRSTQVALHTPDEATLNRMLDACPNAAIKLAPATTAPDAWQLAEREWISRAGECRQQVAWFGSLAERSGARRATRLSRDGAVLGSFVGVGEANSSIAREVGTWLFEPDAAVLAAGLTDEIAERYGLSRVAPRIGYLTGPVRVNEPLMQAFEVIEVLPLRAKKLARWLAERGIGHVELKTRGVKIHPPKLLRELKLRGEGKAVLLAFPREGRPVAAVARRASTKPSKP